MVVLVSVLCVLAVYLPLGKWMDQSALENDCSVVV